MKNFKLSLVTIALALSFSVPALAGVAAADPACGVYQADHFTVNADNTITASFAVEGDSTCSQPVTLMTWSADSTLFPQSQFFTSQTLNDETTGNFTPGIYTLTAKLPVCSTNPNVLHGYQADVIAGANPPSFITAPGTPGFYWTGQPNGQSVVVDYAIAPGTCPAAPVVTPVVTVTPTAPAAPIVTTASTAPAPTALVNTGPGNIVELFAAVTALGTVAYRLVLKKSASRS